MHIFQIFYTHLIALYTVCICAYIYIYIYIFPVTMSLYDYLSVCVFSLHGQKIDQAGGPETFFKTLFGLIIEKTTYQF